MDGREISFLFVLTAAAMSVSVLGQQVARKELKTEVSTISSSLPVSISTNVSQSAIPEVSATQVSLAGSAVLRTFSPSLKPTIDSSRHPTSKPANHPDDQDVDPIKSVLLMIVAGVVPAAFMVCLGCCFVYHRFCCWREQRMMVAAAVLQKEKEEGHNQETGTKSNGSAGARNGFIGNYFLLRRTSFKIPANDWIGIPIEEVIEISTYEKKVETVKSAKPAAWVVREDIFEEIKHQTPKPANKTCRKDTNGNSRSHQTDKQGIEKSSGNRCRKCTAKSDGIILSIGDIPQGTEGAADLLGIEKPERNSSLDTIVQPTRSLSNNINEAADNNLSREQENYPTVCGCVPDKIGSNSRKVDKTTLGTSERKSELKDQNSRRQRQCPSLKDLVQHHIAKCRQSIVSSPVQLDNKGTLKGDPEPVRERVDSRSVLPARHGNETGVSIVTGQPVGASRASLEGCPVDGEQKNFVTENELDKDLHLQRRLYQERMKNKARLREMVRDDTDIV